MNPFDQSIYALLVLLFFGAFDKQKKFTIFKWFFSYLGTDMSSVFTLLFCARVCVLLFYHVARNICAIFCFSHLLKLMCDV